MAKKPYKFYKMTEEYLVKMSNSRGINNLNKYYKPTDRYTKWYKKVKKKKVSEVNLIFAQMAFHGQNSASSGISNVIKFDLNIDKLLDITNNFDVNHIIKYKDNEEVLAKEIRKFTRPTIKDSEIKKIKVNTEYKYAKTLTSCAEFLNGTNNKKDVLKKLKQLVKPKKPKSIEIAKKLENELYNYGPALVCDFLKEFDKEFADLGKPDLHVKDTLKKYYYGSQFKDDYSYIEKLQELTDDINNKLRAKGENKITVYQLDRMIYLICSGQFFLNKNFGTKSDYLSKIK